MQEIEINVAGRIQGVGYRAKVKAVAGELDIRGYIENQEDGSVEIVAQGDKESLEQFIEECRKGTMFSKITEFDVEWHDKARDPFTEFEIW